VCEREVEIIRNAPAPSIVDMNCDELFFLCAFLDIWMPGMSIICLELCYAATYKN
jgi:hypothetical protein